MSEPCKCRDFTCSGNRGFAVLAITGHHPECPTHRPKPMDDETIIGHLLMILDKVRAESEQRRVDLAEMTARAERAQADWVEPVRVANAIVAEFKYPAEPPFREMLIEVVTIVERCAKERNRLRDKLRWVLTAEPEDLDQWRHGEDAAAMVNDTDNERSTGGTL